MYISKASGFSYLSSLLGKIKSICIYISHYNGSGKGSV